ncbi:MAG: response regulator [Vampirovibrionales bacterium]|jgi:OmpR family response regulator RpaB
MLNSLDELDTPEEVTRSERILIVDDEVSIRRILETRFKMLGFDTASAGDGEEALSMFENFNPDIVVLDIMMPKIDGYGVTKHIRSTSDTPIILLTALGDVAERITGLELGADDYVVKPFSPKELEARVKTILRRVNAGSTFASSGESVSKNGVVVEVSNGNGNSSSSANMGLVTIAGVKIDFVKRQVFRQNERIRLTGMEFCLLELLASNSGQPFSRGDILQHVWNYPTDQRIDTRVVDVHVSRLREKLELDKANPELILTARGIGYMFQKL